MFPLSGAKTKGCVAYTATQKGCDKEIDISYIKPPNRIIRCNYASIIATPCLLTFIIETVAAHNALIQSEDVTPWHPISPALVGQITDPHVLRVRLVLISPRSITSVESNLRE